MIYFLGKRTDFTGSVRFRFLLSVQFFSAAVLKTYFDPKVICWEGGGIVHGFLFPFGFPKEEERPTGVITEGWLQSWLMEQSAKDQCVPC